MKTRSTRWEQQKLQGVSSCQSASAEQTSAEINGCSSGIEKPSHGPGFEFCGFFLPPDSSVVLLHVSILSLLIINSNPGGSDVVV